MSNFTAKFDPSMLGQVIEVTVIHSRHTGSSYYDSEINDVRTTAYGGVLAEYGDHSFTFQAIGKARPTVVTWPEVRSGWPDNRWRLEIRSAPEPSDLGTEDER